jgi:hypothetical protein
MEYNLYILFWTVAFCLGWRTVTSEGQLLYFIRKYFEDIESDIEHKEDIGLKCNLWIRLLNFIGRPFVICITCMASIWGITIYLLLTKDFTVVAMVLNCFAASFIQTFIYKKYAQLD